MMAHIRKLKNGTFQAAVYVGTSTQLDKNGKPKKIYEYVTCDTERECKRLARQLETEIEEGKYSNLGNIRFNAWCKKWADVSFNELAPSTIKSYNMYINHHFIPFFKDRKLKDIKEMHIKEYITYKLKTLSANTVKKHFYKLSEIFYDALKAKSPCLDIKPPKKKEYNPEILDDKGFKLLHSAVKGMWDELPILLAAYCGMRAGEIFALKPDDINKEGGYIEVDESLAISQDSKYILKEPKSKRGKRRIATPIFIFDLLDQYRRSQKTIKERLFEIRPDSYSKRFANIIKYHNEMFDIAKRFGYPALDQYLKSHNEKSIRRNISLQKEKLPVVRFHDLRHYHATVLYKHGISDQYASERLGHDIMVLKKIYQHLESETKKEQEQKVIDIFS